MILPIVHAGEPVLRQQARALSPQEIRSKEIQTLISHMRETMRGAPGVGLAAPQIGIAFSWPSLKIVRSTTRTSPRSN